MTTLWRISDHLDLEGNGGRYFSSRWSSRGRRIVFLAESPAGAMLEILVHLPFKNGTLPAKYTLLKIAVPDGFGMAELNPSVRGNWRKRPDVTQRLGDAWLSSADTSLARVPSAVIPQTWNVLLNPEHTDARQIRIEAVIREQFDNRLFRLGVY